MNTKRRFAAFDIDGTLFRSGLYRELVYELKRRKVLPEAVIEDAMAKQELWRKRQGTFDEFEQALVDGFDQHLSQLDPHEYDKAVEFVYENERDHVYIYTRNLVRELADKGYFLIAISGSQHALVERFAAHHGFHAWTGQTYERENGRFTGKVTKTHTGKAALLAHLVDKYDLTYEDSYACGDSNGDMGLLESVEHPVVFNPTEELLDKAKARHWPIVIERKSIPYRMEWSDHYGTYLLAPSDAR